MPRDHSGMAHLHASTRPDTRKCHGCERGRIRSAHRPQPQYRTTLDRQRTNALFGTSLLERIVTLPLRVPHNEHALAAHAHFSLIATLDFPLFALKHFQNPQSNALVLYVL